MLASATSSPSFTAIAKAIGRLARHLLRRKMPASPPSYMGGAPASPKAICTWIINNGGSRVDAAGAAAQAHGPFG